MSEAADKLITESKWVGPPMVEASLLEEAVVAERAKSQAFFAELAASIVAPHVGDQYKQTIEALLKRATERGLYTP